jgi:hypothetical protein
MASDLMEDIAPGLHCYIKKKKMRQWRKQYEIIFWSLFSIAPNIN